METEFRPVSADNVGVGRENAFGRNPVSDIDVKTTIVEEGRRRMKKKKKKLSLPRQPSSIIVNIVHGVHMCGY